MVLVVELSVFKNIIFSLFLVESVSLVAQVIVAATDQNACMLPARIALVRFSLRLKNLELFEIMEENFLPHKRRASCNLE